MVKNGLDMIRYAFKKITHFMQKTQNCKMQMRLNFNFFLKNSLCSVKTPLFIVVSVARDWGSCVSGLIIATRPDTRQDSCRRFGRGGNEKKCSQFKKVTGWTNRLTD